MCKRVHVIVMMDTRNGDGIEVFVDLEDEDMAVFERDAELLGYASFNPCALALRSLLQLVDCNLIWLYLFNN